MSSATPSILKETELLLLKREQEEMQLQRGSASYQPPFVPISTSSSFSDFPPNNKSTSNETTSVSNLSQTFQSVNLGEKQPVTMIGPEKASTTTVEPISVISSETNLYIKPGFNPSGRIVKLAADSNNIYFHVETDVIPDPQDPTKDKKVEMYKDENLLVILDAHSSEKKYMARLLYTAFEKNLEIKVKLSGNRDNKGNREVERVEVQVNWT